MRLLHAVIALARLGIATRFRLGGAYWSWRRETAFGRDAARWPSAAHRRKAMIEYAEWVTAMRSHIRR
ncbi:MAG: hypothetical protein FJ270_03675 [Planctomycetes bacterium]|nr:hypothetical protein [Planctomycetota bacterium]